MTDSTTEWIDDLLTAPNPFRSAKIVAANVSYETYTRQADGVKRGHPEYIMSRGELMAFLECPHKWMAGSPSKETRSTLWGQLIDCLALTPETFSDRFDVEPETYQNEDGEVKPWNNNAKACRTWQAQAKMRGTAVIKPEMLADARTAANALANDDRIAAAMKDAQRQVMVIGEYADKDTGIVVPVRILIDAVPMGGGQFADCLNDLKTARDASHREYNRAIFENDYHVQAALYLDVWNAVGPIPQKPRSYFLHLIQENTAPWETARRYISPEFIALGRQKYLRALNRYCACLKENQWPGFDDESTHRTLNGWTAAEPSLWMITSKEAA